MFYCQNCGSEVSGNFCPNCGVQLGSISTPLSGPIIHENAVVKPRYSTLSLILAAWPGITCLVLTLACCVIYSSYEDFEMKITAFIFGIFLVALAFLCFLPGSSTIIKRSPKETLFSTLGTFFLKSILFFFCWGIALYGCIFIIGIPFQCWRLGLWVSSPNKDQYTAFVDDKKITVTRCKNTLSAYRPKEKWIYVADNTEIYLPSIH